MLRTKQFNYDLPKEFIANDPMTPRDHSLLMAYDVEKGQVSHGIFFGIKDFLKAGDVLVLNSTKVVPARILFSLNGADKEIFLLKREGENVYQALVKPGKFFSVGKSFEINKNLGVEILEVLEDGTRMLKFDGDNVTEELESIGQMPLPPYIKNSSAEDKQYQTVYAKEAGSVAAPTAGLHFTENLLNELREMGVEILEVVLHVGRGTFLPVTADKIAEHKMHPEFFHLSGETAKRLNLAKKEGRRIIAVGTTSVRVLESAYNNGFTKSTGETEIFIFPGSYKWKVVDALVTNFHLPKSTLLMLVASFLESKGEKQPIEKVLELYELAKEKKYRFFSFGDAMFLF